MSRTARAIALSAALIFSLHMVSLRGQQKAPKPAPAPRAAKTTTAKPQAPKTTTTKAATGKHALTKPHTQKAATSKAVAPKGAKPAPKSAKHTTGKVKPAAKTASAKVENEAASVKKAASTKKADSTKKNASAKKSAKKTEAPQAAAATTTTTPPLENLGPVQQKLAKNTSLAAKLQSRLPAGTNLMEAADGFRNLGQFVAAVNVSNNLDIPFEKLKADMVTKKMSLGQSIQDLRPATSASVEAQRAEYDAGTLITQTEQETSMTASAGATTKTSTTIRSSTTAAKPKRSNRKTLTGGL
jgi:hypothetical protein